MQGASMGFVIDLSLDYRPLAILCVPCGPGWCARFAIIDFVRLPPGWPLLSIPNDN